MSKETSFVKNAEELAKQKMDAINPVLSSKFKFLIKFLSQFPEACSKPRSKKMQNKVGQEEHIEYLARSFHESRLPRKPTPPTTVPDEVVSIVLNISFNIQPENLERIKEEHRFSMAAENIVGDLLERLRGRPSNVDYGPLLYRTIISATMGSGHSRFTLRVGSAQSRLSLALPLLLVGDNRGQKFLDGIVKGCC